MRAILRDRGHYELVATSRGSRVLVLNGTAWFPCVLATEDDAAETGEGPPPVQGEFYLVDVVAAPGADARRLFLERGGVFEEVLLPQAPVDPGALRVVLRTGHRATREDLEASLSDRAAAVF